MKKWGIALAFVLVAAAGFGLCNQTIPAKGEGSVISCPQEDGSLQVYKDYGDGCKTGDVWGSCNMFCSGLVERTVNSVLGEPSRSTDYSLNAGCRGPLGGRVRSAAVYFGLIECERVVRAGANTWYFERLLAGAIRSACGHEHPDQPVHGAIECQIRAAARIEPCLQCDGGPW